MEVGGGIRGAEIRWRVGDGRRKKERGEVTIEKEGRRR